MTREAFIKKWLGNKNFRYCEEHRELMRDDLDSVLDFHKQQVKSVDLADVVLSEERAELLCSCGKPSDNPLCFDCFSKGLERDGAK